MSSDNDIRLIDANNMKRHLQALIAEYNSMGDVDSNINATLAQFAVDMLDNAPTVNDCPNADNFSNYEYEFKACTDYYSKEPEMTNEEAIKWLSAIKDKYIHGGDEEFDEKRRIAIDIAIRALKEGTNR